MTSPDPVPLPLGPLAAIVTTEGMTLSATEVTGQALAVDVDAEVTGLTLDPDYCVAPTMRPPTTPPTTSADPSANHRSHRRGPRACLGSPKAAPIRAAEHPAALGKDTSLARLSHSRQLDDLQQSCMTRDLSSPTRTRTARGAEEVGQLVRTLVRTPLVFPTCIESRSDRRLA